MFIIDKFVEDARIERNVFLRQRTILNEKNENILYKILSRKYNKY